MKELFKNLKWVWNFAKGEKEKIITRLIFSVIYSIISVIVPILSAKIMISLTNNMLSQLLVVSLIVCLIEYLRNFINYFSSYYAQVIYRESFISLQTELGTNILRLTNTVLDSEGSGVFIERLTTDTSRIADVFNRISRIGTEVITKLGMLCAMFVISKLCFLYMLLFTIILYLIENRRINKFIKKDEVHRKKHEKISGFVSEIVRGSRDIKMLNAEKSFIKKLKVELTELNNYRYEMEDNNRKYMLLRSSVRDTGDFLLIVLLVFLISTSRLEIALALVIYNYSSRVVDIAYFFSDILDYIKDFNLSSRRVFDILNSDEFTKEKFGDKHIDKLNGNFEFKNVKFSYEKGNEVLKDVSFKVKANETVAFVGKSGAGKTTIFNLLCKMYDISEGSILMDGININELDKDSIRGNITIISQNPYIFNLSIKDNFKLVKNDVTMEEIEEACKLACLDEFINTLPNKYDTLIGEGGVNLSGGQKQRLAIARALIQKTEIILFDEATSALDNETQADIQKAINNMKNEYTILIIAHRLSTIKNSDRILLLEDGIIKASGTHKELLSKSKEYKKLYETEIID